MAGLAEASWKETRTYPPSGLGTHRTEVALGPRMAMQGSRTEEARCSGQVLPKHRQADSKGSGLAGLLLSIGTCEQRGAQGILCLEVSG